MTSIVGYAATSPRRRTPPLRQTSSATFAYAADAPLLSLCDIFPVSSGTFTRFIGRACPIGESKLCFSFYRKIKVIEIIAKNEKEF